MTDERDQQRPLGSRWSTLAMVVLGCALVAITAASFRTPNTDTEILLLAGATVGLVASTAVLLRFGWSSVASSAVVGASTIGIMLVLAVTDWSVVSQVRVIVVMSAFAGCTALLVLARIALSSLTLVVMGAVLIAVFLAASASVLGSDVEMDVVHLHEQAADALASGNNPYTTGNVSVWEDRPGDDLELIKEYTYPPATLVWYSAAAWLTGDSRWAGAFAVAAACLILLVHGARSPMESGMLWRCIAAIAFIVGNPLTLLMVSLGWNETIALPAFVLALALWRRSIIGTAVAVGLAIATKQYFILIVPALAVLPDPASRKRLVIALATCLATFVPFLLWDAGGLVAGTVTHHLTRAPRSDGLTLAGLGIVLPTIVAVGASVVVGLLLARQRQGAGPAYLAFASALAVFTVLAVRGFRNSWWLVIVLVVVALVDAVEPENPDELSARSADDEHQSSSSVEAGRRQR
ncbi:MAG: hypothetical protein ACR2N2_04990 [Acidimicrobiia bacterium]